MKFRAVANPGQSVGQRYSETKEVVPNMAMSLQEILERFTRGEPLEVGKDVSFDEQGEDDLEKVRHMDLVDREEYVNKLKATKKRFDKEERERKRRFEEAAKMAAIEEQKAELAAKLAAEKPAK